MSIDLAEPDLSSRFAVVVHDVAPVHGRQLEAIFKALGPLVGDRLIGAVVPCWHGIELGSATSRVERDWVARVKSACGEIVQHGYTHQQLAPGLISFWSGGANELQGLARAETADRLRRGQAILHRCFGGAVVGFIPPAWWVGRATPAELARHGFRYLVEFAAIRSVEGPTIPLATWSWDWGVVASLGRVGERLGWALARIRPRSLPCVVAHPRDVDRGYLPRIVRVVEELLLRGRTPVTFAELASWPSPRSPA